MDARLLTKIEKYGFAPYVLKRFLEGEKIKVILDEINQLAYSKKFSVRFTRFCVTSFLERCGAAYSLYQRDLVKKTLLPVIDVIEEAAKNAARLIKAAETADKFDDIKSLVAVSKVLNDSLRLLGELEKKLDTAPKITIQQVNAIVLGIAEKVEHADSISINVKGQILEFIANALPDDFTGAANATKSLAKRNT